jgi:DNA-binding NarL/FixJ family response regulator
VNRINLYVAQNNFLMNEGFKSMFVDSDIVHYCGFAADSATMRIDLMTKSIDVVLMDYSSTGFAFNDALFVLERFPSVALIGITHQCNVQAINKLIQTGISGHLLSDCDKEEIEQSVSACFNRERFFCGKVIDQLNEAQGNSTSLGCEAVTISERELEILHLIAEGLTTKQIAAKLHLSFHTVMTHRKNMMAKLGLNNTAGLITYAGRENLISPNKFLFS